MMGGPSYKACCTLLALVLWLPWSVLAQTGKRVALVVGNAAYTHQPLRNPVNDANLMNSVLTELGFDVTVVRNADRRTLRNSLRDFEFKSRDAEVSLFYFAGHGVQVGGNNYLLPINAAIQDERDVVDEAVDAANVLRRMTEARARVGLIILDACRDNPYAGSTRSATRGLTRVEPPTGTIVAFATGSGETAADGDGFNGVYTEQLARQLRQPGLDVKDVFDLAAVEVERITLGKQRPREDVGLRNKYVLNVAGLPPPRVVEPAPAPLPQPRPLVAGGDADIEELAWAAAQKANSKAALDAYLRAYPQGRYTNVAAVLLAAITPPPAAAVVPPKPTAASVTQDCAGCPKLVTVAAGSFMMGSPADEADRETDEGPQFKVSLPRFMLAQTEVTVAQFREFVRDKNYLTDAERGTGNAGCYAWDASDGKWEWRRGLSWLNPGWPIKDSEPVTCVSWTDAQAYIAWLSQKTGKAYFMPSEAQWEYAARAGSQSSRPWGDDPHLACRYANVADQSTGPDRRLWTNRHECRDANWFVAPVGTYEANALGIHDMLGNVWEWVQDCGDNNYIGAPSNGSARVSGDCSVRTYRGGGWDSRPLRVRSALRFRHAAANRNANLGFRVARSAE